METNYFIHLRNGQIVRIWGTVDTTLCYGWVTVFEDGHVTREFRASEVAKIVKH